MIYGIFFNQATLECLVAQKDSTLRVQCTATLVSLDAVFPTGQYSCYRGLK